MNIYIAETNAERPQSNINNWRRPCVIDRSAAYIAHREAIGDPMSEEERLHWRLCQLHHIDWPFTKYNARGWLPYVQPLRDFQMRLVRGLKRYSK